jgi:manganese-dependent inorganic pyrophosphatase
MNTYIIGHLKPDTDAVVSAMAWAFLCQNVTVYQTIKNPTPVITDPLNPETSFLFKKFNLSPPKIITANDINKEDEIILVDHNEESQRLTGINPEQIVTIIDHHKLNLNLTSPIYLTSKPWGATCTIIGHLLINTHQTNPDPKLANLMLAAILSDTVGFKSSTCTPFDIKIAKQLQSIAQIDDLDALTLEIFKAKSDISTLSPTQIIQNDYKIFDFGKKTFINQLETVEQEELLKNRKAELLDAMQTTKQSKGVDLLFVAITDIIQANTKLLILGEKEGNVATQAFGGKVEDNILDIGPKLSRKKDIAPAIEKVLGNSNL